MTDEEIERGIIGYTGHQNRTLCFIREIEDINLNHPKAWRFIDQHNDGTIDQEAQEHLQQLKDKLSQKMEPQNMHHFQVKWSNTEGINEVDHAG